MSETTIINTKIGDYDLIISIHEDELSYMFKDSYMEPYTINTLEEAIDFACPHFSISEKILLVMKTFSQIAAKFSSRTINQTN